MRNRLAALTVLAAVLAVALPRLAPTARAADRCGATDAVGVAGGRYIVQNNLWGASTPQCMSVDGTSFSVTSSGHHNATNGAPASYPSVYRGCHWGTCSSGSGLPLRVGGITSATSSWSTTQPAAGAYDVAYDIWFNTQPTTGGQPDGAELMIWLNSRGGVQPAGSVVAGNVPLAGATWNVWFSRPGWNYVAFVRTSGTTAVRGLDLRAFMADAVRRGYLQTAWYLLDVEAGFEIWQGGNGLATNSFSASVS